jgi:hypothetical protein
MRGTLKDFMSKHGFRDGTGFEKRDDAARDELIRQFNQRIVDYKAVALDVLGAHNPCRLLFFKRQAGWGPRQYIDAWRRHAIDPVDPVSIDLKYLRYSTLDALLEHIYEFELDVYDD